MTGDAGTRSPRTRRAFAGAALLVLAIGSPAGADATEADRIMRDLLSGRMPVVPTGAERARVSPSPAGTDAAFEAAAELARVSGGSPGDFAAAVVAATAAHPRLKAAAARVAGAGARIDEARAGLFPSVDAGLTGRSSWFNQSEEDLDGNRRDDGFTTDAVAFVSVRQLLFDAGATGHRVDQARAERDAAENMSEAERTEVMLAAISAHHAIVGFRVMLGLADRNMVAHGEILEAVAARARAGAAGRGDVVRAEARLADAEAERVTMAERLAEAEADYAAAFGEPPAAPRLPALRLDLPDSAEAAGRLALERSAEVRAARARFEATRYGERAQASTVWPTLHAEAGVTKFDVSEMNDNVGASVRLVLRGNLFDGGARSARDRAALAAVEEATHTEAAVRREAIRRASTAFATWRAVDERVRLTADAARAAERARSVGATQFHERGGDLLDLLQDQREVYAASVRWAQAAIDREIAAMALLGSTGGLDVLLGEQGGIAPASETAGALP